MSAVMIRPSLTRNALCGFSRIATATAPASRTVSMQSTRGKATLPDLPYSYSALEPAISGRIMELHHKNHHQTYVNGYNAAAEKLEAAQNSPSAQIGLQPLINFHGGGHINHSLFWENLAPSAQGGGGEPGAGGLKSAIEASYGSVDELKKLMNAKLAGIQGSGWAWLVKDTETGKVGVRTYANQDPVIGQYVPLLGIDAWEHAYYLQYQNRKAEYFANIWDVINWKTVEKRFQQ